MIEVTSNTYFFLRNIGIRRPYSQFIDVLTFHYIYETKGYGLIDNIVFINGENY